ncbi:MAG: 3-keto-disaccharide hydrolase [Limisphaerales bacterium]
MSGVALGQPASNPIPPITSVIRLFNGRDLTGFRTWLVDTHHQDPQQVFTVTNRLIRISGEGLGYLATEHEFENYHLVAEFKWGRRNWPWGDRVGKARDSGIFLHAIGPDGNSHDGHGAFQAAIECNLFQGAVGDFLLIRGNAADGSLLAPHLTAEVAAERDTDGWPFWQKGGQHATLERWGRLNWFGKDHRWQDRIDFRGARDVESPPGAWTRVECLCDGDHILIKVNGAAVNEAFHVFPHRGKILLQCEGSEVFFRRLELRPLKASIEKAAPSGTTGR